MLTRQGLSASSDVKPFKLSRQKFEGPPCNRATTLLEKPRERKRRNEKGNNSETRSSKHRSSSIRFEIYRCQNNDTREDMPQ